MITAEKLKTLIGSARANRKDALDRIRKAQEETREILASYDGAISVLQLLLDDLCAQDMDAQANKDYLTLDELKKMMPEGVEVEGIVLKDGE